MNIIQYRLDTFRRVLALVLVLIVMNGSILAQEGSVFSDQVFDYRYLIDIYWESDGNQKIAVQARTSPNIFILDGNLNEIGNLDPFMDISLGGDEGVIQNLAWNSNGNWLAVPIGETQNGTFLQIWDWQSNTFKSFSFPPINWVTWSPSENIIAIVLENRIVIWDAINESTVYELTLPGFPIIQGASWKPDGSQIAALNVQGVLQIWDVQTGNVVFSLNEDNALLEFAEIESQGKALYGSLSWEPGSSRIALSDRTNSTLEIWDTASQARVYSYPLSDSYVALAWGNDGFVTIDRSRLIKWWDIESGDILQQINLNEDESFVFIRWHPYKPEFVYVVATPTGSLGDLIKTIPAPSIPPS